MSRTAKIAVGALVVLLVAAPFVPRGGDDEGSLTPRGEKEPPALATADTAGFGRVTPDMRAEIDRVVDTGSTVGRIGTKTAPTAMASELVRCAVFDGQRYCLHTGWTERSQAEVQARVSSAARVVSLRSGAEQTGDLDPLATLERSATMSPAARAEADRRELTEAARSVAKVWLLRHEIEGVTLPHDFLAEHPEARASTSTTDKSSTSETTTTTKPKTRKDYPRRGTVLRTHRVAQQQRTYWCGPTTMQMIAWGWQHKRMPQRFWARHLGTTSGGTAISDMVRTVNRTTGYDNRWHAGPYIVLDISHWSFQKWLLLQMRHIVDYRAPVVLHPVLLKKYYPYLAGDASGHFQVGRGYDKNGKRPPLLGYFEPWNQQRFDPSEPYISRVQWRSAYNSYRANEAHYQQNIGV